MDNVGYSCNVDTPYPTHNQDRSNREAKSKKYERLEKQLEELAKGTNSLDELAEKVSESQYTISRDKTTGRVYNIKPKGSKIDRTKTDQNVYLKVPGYNNPDEFVKNGCKLPPKVWKHAYGECFREDIEKHNKSQKEKGHPERANLTVDKLYDKDLEKQKNNTKAKIKSPMRSVLLQYGGEHDDINLNDPEYRKRACKALQETYKKITEQIPEKYIFQATIHMDESTPHLHLVLLPIAKASGHREHTPNFTKFMEQELGLKPEKSMIPNKDGTEKAGENVLNTFRNNFIRIMDEVGKEYGFNREDKHTVEHKDQEEYKKYDNIIKGKNEEIERQNGDINWNEDILCIQKRNIEEQINKIEKNKEHLKNIVNEKEKTKVEKENLENKNKELTKKNSELENETKELEKENLNAKKEFLKDKKTELEKKIKEQNEKDLKEYKILKNSFIKKEDVEKILNTKNEEIIIKDEDLETKQEENKNLEKENEELKNENERIKNKEDLNEKNKLIKRLAEEKQQSLDKLEQRIPKKDFEKTLKELEKEKEISKNFEKILSKITRLTANIPILNNLIRKIIEKDTSEKELKYIEQLEYSNSNELIDNEFLEDEKFIKNELNIKNQNENNKNEENEEEEG